MKGSTLILFIWNIDSTALPLVVVWKDGRKKCMIIDIKPTPTSTCARRGLALYGVIMPLLAGCTMLSASLLPWLIDPLGKAFSAWQLPIDIGWQVRSGIFSYGLLCLCCGLYAFFIAYRTWTRGRAGGPSTGRYVGLSRRGRGCGVKRRGESATDPGNPSTSPRLEDSQ